MSRIVELREITKKFNGKTALSQVNLEINEGEILALLGPNGSGKTTFLKILAFIEKPTSGEIRFLDEVVTDENMAELRVQSTMVFQKTVLFSATVYDNVAYGLRMRNQPKKKIEEEVRRALALVKLGGFERRMAKKLSGGEQQRVALARALALDAKLLLLDEPTANLDPKNASIVEKAINILNRERGTTIVMATHNMFQAKNLPHRIALMADGKISEVGKPSEIFGKLSRTLASFAAVANTFAGNAEVSGEGTTLVDIGNGVHVEVVDPVRGGVSVFVSPEDIIVSKTPVASSARNVLKGKIVEVVDLGVLVRLRVNVGKSFTVQVTKRSFNEMGLNLGSEVFLAFKASSVQIL